MEVATVDSIDQVNNTGLNKESLASPDHSTDTLDSFTLSDLDNINQIPSKVLDVSINDASEVPLNPVEEVSDKRSAVDVIPETEESLSSPSQSETCIAEETKHITDTAQVIEAVAVKDEVIIDPVIDEVNTSTEGEDTAAVEVLPLQSEESLESLSDMKDVTQSSSLHGDAAIEDEEDEQAVDTIYTSDTIHVTRPLSAAEDHATESVPQVDHVAADSSLATAFEPLNDTSSTAPITDEENDSRALDSAASPPLDLDVAEYNDTVNEAADTLSKDEGAVVKEDFTPEKPLFSEPHVEEEGQSINQSPSETESATLTSETTDNAEVAAEIQPDVIGEADLSSKPVTEDLVVPALTAESGSDAATVVKVKTVEDVGGDSKDRQPDSVRETTAFSEPVAVDPHAPTLTTVGVSDAVAVESETRQVKGMVGHAEIAPSTAEQPHEDDGAKALTEESVDVTVSGDINQLESEPAVDYDQPASPILSIFVDGHNSDPTVDDMEERTAAVLIEHKDSSECDDSIAVTDDSDSDSLISMNEMNTFSAFLTVTFFILIIALFSVREGTYRSVLLSILLWPVRTIYQVVYTVISVLFGWVYTILYTIVYGRTGVEYGEDDIRTDSDSRYQTSHEVDAGTPTRSSGGKRQGASPSSTGILIH